MIFRYPFANALLAMLLACSILPSAEASPRSDAIRSADFAARSAVQTVYHNLIVKDYEWRWIRDQKLPEILRRATRAIKREATGMDRSLLLKHYVPAYVSAFYAEVDKLNAQHQVKCMDTVFLANTIIPFISDLKEVLAGIAELLDIRVPILESRHSYHTCQTIKTCQQQLSANYYATFHDSLPDDEFYPICAGEYYY